jgi:hypothetical protein
MCFRDAADPALSSSCCNPERGLARSWMLSRPKLLSRLLLNRFEIVRDGVDLGASGGGGKWAAALLEDPPPDRHFTRAVCGDGHLAVDIGDDLLAREFSLLADPREVGWSELERPGGRTVAGTVGPMTRGTIAPEEFLAPVEVRSWSEVNRKTDDSRRSNEVLMLVCISSTPPKVHSPTTERELYTKAKRARSVVKRRGPP